jgi:hypothetical protein
LYSWKKKPWGTKVRVMSSGLANRVLGDHACVFSERETLMMDGAGDACARLFRMMIAAGLLVTVSGTAAMSNENCRRLEELARQYAGVQLTSSQQHLKRKLVSWYNTNCKRTRSAEARN